MIFKPVDILYEGIARTVIYSNAPSGPPGMPGVMSRFDQKMQLYWMQLKEQIRLADEFVRNHQIVAGLKIRMGTTSGSPATTTGFNTGIAGEIVDGIVEGVDEIVDGVDEIVDGIVDGITDGTAEGTAEGTPGNQQGNDSSPTSTTPSQDTGSSNNPGEAPSTNTTDQNESATP